MSTQPRYPYHAGRGALNPFKVLSQGVDLVAYTVESFIAPEVALSSGSARVCLRPGGIFHKNSRSLHVAAEGYGRQIG